MEEKILDDQEIHFVTLGMFIIDEIHYKSPTINCKTKASSYDILGGAGSYAALGARILSPPPESKAVGWIVDKGSDFPQKIEDTINSWGTSCHFRTDINRLTTRGWNGYNDEEETREFRYATPKLRLTANDLSSPFLASKAYHLICSATRAIELVSHIKRRRAHHHPDLPKPIFVWEPVPDLMVPEELLEVTRALSCVDICSPNHTELGTLMATSAIFPDGSIDKSFIETATEQLIDSFPLSTFAVVVRCGKEGCYIGKNGGSLQKRPMRLAKPDPVPQRPTNAVAYGSNAERDLDELMLRLGNWSNRSSASQSSEDDSESESESDDEPKPDWGTWAWLPAVHADPSKVIDPTGGGNAFLGGLAVGLARGKGLKESAMMGNVSASFAIEQVGMPQLRRNENGLETWNGEVAETRLGRYRERNK